MADRYLLESGAPDGYQLEDGSGVLIIEETPAAGESGFIVFLALAALHSVTLQPWANAQDDLPVTPTAVVEETEWRSPVPAWQVGRLVQARTADEDIVPQPVTFPGDEDGWSPRIPTDRPVYLVGPFAWAGQDEVGFTPEEELWQRFIVQPSALQRLYVHDQGEWAQFVAPPAIAEEDYWLTLVPYRARVLRVRAPWSEAQDTPYLYNPIQEEEYAPWVRPWPAWTGLYLFDEGMIVGIAQPAGRPPYRVLAVDGSTVTLGNPSRVVIGGSLNVELT